MSQPLASVLIVEDDASISGAVTEILKAGNYVASSVSTVKRAIVALRSQNPDVIILDRQLPDGDGLELCRQLRKDGSNIPIIFLSGKKTMVDRVLGLDAGGDDYLPKPFTGSELMARIRAILRRAIRTTDKAILTFGPLRLDLAAHRAYIDKKEISLWPKEFEMLAVLLREPERVFSRSVMLELVWGSGREIERFSNVVDVTVSNLRRKLGGFGCAIATIRGQGFRLEMPVAVAR